MTVFQGLRSACYCGAAAMFMLSFGGLVCAEPFTPATPQTVVEKLPSRSQFAELRLTEKLRRQLQLAPQDDALALTLVRAYFDAAMALGDPRQLGYAQAVFVPRFARHRQEAQWWFTSGLLKQYGHDFAGAFTDFEQALTLEPAQIEAISWSAALHMVEGEYPDALKFCERLPVATHPLVRAGCRQFALAGMGHLRPAYENLRAALDQAGTTDKGLTLWVRVRLGEMAERLGQDREAAGHYQVALQLGQTDQYLLAAYADFLLRQKQAAQVVTLLRSWEASDVLLLRLAMAAAQTSDVEAMRYRQMLKTRFEEAARRGERLHEQEEARFLLLLEQAPQEALERALHNYQALRQREPRDAEMVLLAALAANKPQAAGPVLEWLTRTGFEDARLRPLLKQFKQASAP